MRILQHCRKLYLYILLNQKRLYFVLIKILQKELRPMIYSYPCTCLLYTSDAADEQLSVDLGGRRIIKKKKFFQAEDGIRDSGSSRGLGDVYKRQLLVQENIQI